MTDKFQNKYRIASARLPGWDYGWNAPYFVTICTKDRECFFGEIVNGEMNLSKTGVIADLMWYEIKNHAKGVELGEFIVMPNHVHGIILLNGNDERPQVIPNINDGPHVETRHALSLDQNEPTESNETRHALSLQQNEPTESNETRRAMSLQQNDRPDSNETRHALSLQNTTPAQQRFQNQGKNTLSSIVGGYKAAVTKHANRLKFDFAWQPRFYDHIIRDEQSFQTISNYILNNAQNWSQDKFFK
jgi:REP element-mobilizing transposase RayT